MMKMSIRARITLLITFVFISVLVLLLSSEMLAIYLGMTGEIDRELRRERNFVRELFERGIFHYRSGLGRSSPNPARTRKIWTKLLALKPVRAAECCRKKRHNTPVSDSRHDVEIAQIRRFF